VSRLDNIVTRNRSAQRRGLRKLIVTGSVLVLLVVIAVMLLFTDWGQPAVDKRATPTHVDGVYIGKPKAH